MSPTSYQLLYPAMLSAKVRRIFLKSKFSCQTLPDSARLYRPLRDSAWSCSSQQNQAKSAEPADSGGISGPRQTQQSQRTLIWLSILARTLALVQSLSLDSRMASSLWPYPPTIDRSRPRQNQQNQQSQRTPADSCRAGKISGP